MNEELLIHSECHPTGSAVGQVRYSFTAQFLRGAARFAALSRDLESKSKEGWNENEESDHRAFVVAAVMQSTASLEAEIAEILDHGPGHHLGSNGIDAQARKFLQPLADVVDHNPVLERYQLVLHLLRKEPFDRGGQPFQAADVLVRLRNEIVHYRSKWGPEMESEKLFAAVRNLRFQAPPFVSAGTNFFPFQCLVADCAAWAVRTGVSFIEEFYKKLAISSPLAAYKSNILTLAS